MAPAASNTKHILGDKSYCQGKKDGREEEKERREGMREKYRLTTKKNERLESSHAFLYIPLPLQKGVVYCDGKI